MKKRVGFIEVLYKEKYDILCRYVYRIISDSEMAEDIVQETFYEAYRNGSLLQKHEKPEAWLYQTAKNKMMKIAKKEQRFVMTAGALEEIKIDDFSELINLQNSLATVLTEEERWIVYEFYECGYSAKEIAEKLEISENCFRTRLFRIREKIKSILE